MDIYSICNSVYAHDTTYIIILMHTLTGNAHTALPLVPSVGTTGPLSQPQYEQLPEKHRVNVKEQTL